MSLSMKQILTNRIALVTGASRGIGRGIAEELGRSGATVIITGRSRDNGDRTEDLPGTIEETAALVNELGGLGVALYCDHADDDSVLQLARTIEAQFGRLDILVNNVWGGYEQYDPELFSLDPAEQPLWRWDRMFDVGVRAHYTTTHAVLSLLRVSDRPLVVYISAGDNGKFLSDIQYDVAKAAIDRLGFSFAARLKSEGLVSVVIHPGFTRTERVEAAAPEDALELTHSPRFVGRGVVALACDDNAMRWSGEAVKIADLGRVYDFPDIDDSRPEPFVIPAYGSQP